MLAIVCLKLVSKTLLSVQNDKERNVKSTEAAQPAVCTDDTSMARAINGRTGAQLFDNCVQTIYHTNSQSRSSETHKFTFHPKP